MKIWIVIKYRPEASYAFDLWILTWSPAFFLCLVELSSTNTQSSCNGCQFVIFLLPTASLCSFLHQLTLTFSCAKSFSMKETCLKSSSRTKRGSCKDLCSLSASHAAKVTETTAICKQNFMSRMTSARSEQPTPFQRSDFCFLCFLTFQLRVPSAENHTSLFSSRRGR